MSLKVSKAITLPGSPRGQIFPHRFPLPSSLYILCTLQGSVMLMEFGMLRAKSLWAPMPLQPRSQRKHRRFKWSCASVNGPVGRPIVGLKKKSNLTAI